VINLPKRIFRNVSSKPHWNVELAKFSREAGTLNWTAAGGYRHWITNGCHSDMLTGRKGYNKDVNCHVIQLETCEIITRTVRILCPNMYSGRTVFVIHLTWLHWPVGFSVTYMSQDRQCAHNLTLRRMRANSVATERQYNIFWVFICVFRYPASNAHAPYCHLWPIRLYNTDK
jgi:hypothetical protein